MKRIYCLALVMSLAVGCESDDASEGTAVAEEQPGGGASPVSTSQAISDRLGIEWISVESGTLIMGSDIFAESVPIHTVIVTPFEITATEVTVTQYRACVDAGRCSQPSQIENCNWNVEGRESHPINCVDWGQARTFAKWVGADVDLPTEAEWEYAARGGQDFIYAGSNDPDEVAWYDETSGGSTHPVGTKQANGYGLYDMSGNVYEWVLDEWQRNYEGAPTVSDEVRGEVPECGQVCDTDRLERTIRGGHWSTGGGFDLYVANRRHDSSDSRRGHLGFRLRRTR